VGGSADADPDLFIIFEADPDPACYPDADAGPNPGSQNDADPDPQYGQTLSIKSKQNYLNRKEHA
jgi:hypothetical protein